MTRATASTHRAATHAARMRSALVGWLEPYQSWIEHRAAADAAKAAAPQPPRKTRRVRSRSPSSRAALRQLRSSVDIHHEIRGNRRADHQTPTPSTRSDADQPAVARPSVNLKGRVALATARPAPPTWRLEQVWENEGGATLPTTPLQQSMDPSAEHEIRPFPTYLEKPLFTRTDLTTLYAQAPPLAVSIFMPTHVRGAEVRQGPIRLKNLLTQVRDELTAIGLRETEADEFIAPARALVDDYSCWQHQDQGLALFLDSAGLRRFKVPLPLTEQIVVGTGFHLKPLLPLLTGDGAYYILTMTAERARLYTASRFTCAEVRDADFPAEPEIDRREPGDKRPTPASPAARPKAGFVGSENAWAEGDRPTRWRESRLRDFARDTAVAVEHRLAANPQPLIIVADAKTAGQFKKISRSAVGPMLAGFIEANPESMTPEQLHAAAFTLMLKHLDAPRAHAEEQLDTLLGRDDPRATAVIGEVVRAAYQGRVDTIFLPQHEAVWGRYEQDIDQIITGSEMEHGDLLESAAVQTLQHGGTVHLLSETAPPTAAAVLRY